MAKQKVKRRKGLIIAGILILLLVGLAVYQFVKVERAHSSFTNYYNFRGCTQLLQRGSDYAVCRTGSGQDIKIVEYRGRWYLNHDLPMCMQNFCF